MSDLLTDFSVADIQRAVRYGMTDSRQDVAVRNVAWGFFRNIEVDLLTVSRSDYLHDWEIKRSWSDFLADFKKKHFHDDIRIKHLTFCLPDCIAGEKLKSWCAENYKSFRRDFDFVFYTATGNECKVHDTMRLESIYDGGMMVGRKRVPNNPYHVSDYITEDMRAEIVANDKAAPYRRRLFLEEKCDLFRLAAIKAF